MHTIYVLEDQRYSDAASVRYVGITEDVYSRFSQHLQCAGSNIEKNLWVQELRANNVMLIMRTLETVETFGEARDREDYWMQYYFSQGARLLNMQISKTFTYQDFLAAFGKTGPLPPTVKKANEEKRIYAITKREAALQKRCSIKDIEQGITEGTIKEYGHNHEKVVVSSLKNFVPSKRRLKIVNG